jgi:hypothetical protein
LTLFIIIAIRILIVNSQSQRPDKRLPIHACAVPNLRKTLVSKDGSYVLASHMPCWTLKPQANSRPAMPIILSTGFNEKIDEEKGKGMGIGQYIEKPLNKCILATVVRKTLDEIRDME